MHDPARLHLATVNLWNWAHERVARTERVVEWVNANRVEVLCVQEVLVEDGWDTVAEICARTDLRCVTPREDADGPVQVAVLSAHPATSSALVDLRVGPVTRETRCAALADIDVAGMALAVCSAHLAWGGTREALRLRQAQRLVEMFDARLGGPDSDAPAIIAGDFNTTHTAETFRYLTGLTTHQPGTFWTDAWDAAAAGNTDGTTSDGANPYVETMAQLFRPGANGTLRNGMLPDRRIDFVLSRGWRYGRAFSPCDTSVVREPLMSDHYAVSTWLLLPSAA